MQSDLSDSHINAKSFPGLVSRVPVFRDSRPPGFARARLLLQFSTPLRGAKLLHREEHHGARRRPQAVLEQRHVCAHSSWLGTEAERRLQDRDRCCGPVLARELEDGVPSGILPI